MIMELSEGLSSQFSMRALRSYLMLSSKLGISHETSFVPAGPLAQSPSPSSSFVSARLQDPVNPTLRESSKALTSASTISVRTPPYFGTLEAVLVAVVADVVVEVEVYDVIEVLVVGFAVPVTVVAAPVG